MDTLRADTYEQTVLKEYLALPETTMAELIDGVIYNMASPSRQHQKILGELYAVIHDRTKKHGKGCEVYPAPFSVKLAKDKDNYLEPDISIICDKDKLTDAGCEGAPDWIIEIVSPGDPRHDYIKKLNLYEDAGVREYWIVDPMESKVTVYTLEKENFHMSVYTFADTIPVSIGDDFTIDFSKIDTTI